MSIIEHGDGLPSLQHTARPHPAIVKAKQALSYAIKGHYYDVDSDGNQCAGTNEEFRIWYIRTHRLD